MELAYRGLANKAVIARGAQLETPQIVQKCVRPSVGGGSDGELLLRGKRRDVPDIDGQVRGNERRRRRG